jgi:tetratricopeptide (TPR) repeat protein
MSKRRRTRRVDVVPVTRATWALAALAAAGLLTYANSVSHPFMFDDHGTVVMNAQIRDVGNLSRVLSPPPDTPVGGRPLVNLSFALNFAAGGLDPRGYRVVNLALHIGCGLLLFGLVRRTLDANLAFAVAVLWLVHPLNSEVVDYVSERTESMMAVCYLLTLSAAARAHDPASGPPPGVWTATAIAACAAGMACKESMVTAPLVVACYDRVFLFDSLRTARRVRWRLYAGLAATWGLLAILMASHPRTISNGFSTTIVSPWTYLLNQTQIVTRYLRLVVWPDALTLNYGWPRALVPADVWPYALLLAVLSAAAVTLSVRRPRVAFLVTVFVVTLAPASSILPVGAEVGAERRMYLPLAALLTLVVAWAGAFLRRRAFQRYAAVLLLVVGAALALRTFFRNDEYASPLVMARTVLARWPTPVAEHLVGTELASAGDHDGAILHLRNAAPGYAPAHYDLGRELVKQGHPEEGIAELQAFIREEPGLLTVRDARITMSSAFAELHQTDQAIEQLQLVLAASPGDADAHRMLGYLFTGAQQFGAAIREYRAVVSARPADAAGWTGLGIASIAAGRLDDAVAAFRRAAADEPQNAGYRENLARALLDRGDATDAAPEVQEALRLSPGDAAAHELAGRVLEAQHRLAEARAEFTAALRIDPSYGPAQDGLRRVK